MDSAIRIVYIVTVPESAFAFLRAQFRALKANGYEVSLISSPGPKLDALQRELGIRTYSVKMERGASPLLDLISFFGILRVLFRVRPSIVNYATPKAGLLGALAAWFARVPIRVYELRGLRLETVVGLKRRVLAVFERLTSFCSTDIVCVSRSLLAVYREAGFSRPDKLAVFGKGTYHGVDANAASTTTSNSAKTGALRRELRIPDSAKVIGYVGRLTRDKGIADLFRSFAGAGNGGGERILLLVGPIERGDPLPDDLIEKMRNHPDIRLVGPRSDVASYYKIMDAFAFPSYREGLPQAPLEAAYAGVPTVGYAATGTVDAVVDGKTGLLVPVGRIDEMRKALILLLEDDALRATLGANAKAYARREFSPERGPQAWLDFYTERLTRLQGSARCAR